MKEKEYVIGIDLGGTNIKGAAIKRDGTVKTTKTTKTDVASGYQTVLKRIASLAKEISNGAETTRPLKIGIGCPGAIDFQNGVIVSSPNFPDWKNVPLANDLMNLTGYKVILENDANAAAVGEKFAGAAYEWDNFLMFTLGTGVGSGLLLNGNLWRGPTGMASEAGHLPVFPDGKKCGCGSSGCLEQYSSAKAVSNIAISTRYGYLADQNREGHTITAVDVVKGAESDDEHCQTILENAGEALGIAIGSIALLLGITKFVAGGGMAPALPYMKESIIKAALERAFTLERDDLEIVTSKLDNKAGMIGAASLAFNDK